MYLKGQQERKSFTVAFIAPGWEKEVMASDRLKLLEEGKRHKTAEITSQ